MPQMHPYVSFSGTCEQAFEFYQSVFGGELQLTRFSEMPSDESAPPIDGNLVMHVSLPIGEGQILMGSDHPAAMGPLDVGNNVQVMVTPDSSAEGKRIFEALAAGGQVTMPYEQAFWGDVFGALVDQFGIHWMVNYSDAANA